MIMDSVTSSNIAAVGYDADTQKMRVEFHNGMTYEYDGVSKVMYEDLINAPSVGQFFNVYIRSSYPYQEV